MEDGIDTQFKAAVISMNRDLIHSPRTLKAVDEWDGSFSRSERLVRELTREREEEAFILLAAEMLLNA